MKRFRRISICAVLAAAFPAASPHRLAHAQAPQAQPPLPISCAVRGVVRDSSRRPIAGAAVFLNSHERAFTGQTNATGAFCFATVAGGVFTLQAKMAGYGTATSSPFVVATQPTAIDLTLQITQPSSNPSAAQLRFFDEPHFTVAGVTDTTNSGGHGSSNALFRNREALVKETASLGESSSGNPPGSSGQAGEERSLRQEIEGQPDSFQANSRLGKLLVEEKKPAAAIPYLERASKLNPGDYENNYALALADFDSADYNQAHDQIVSLLHAQTDAHEDQAAPHHLLAMISEKLGDPLEAVREYQRAAELDPSEANVFDWGSELLLHRAAEPAIEVLTKGHQLFPQSVRMLAALGAAWYESGSYQKAAQSLCRASDLNPSDPDPYLFMGRMQATEAVPSAAVAERLRRFAKLHPESATANYYYAVSLSKSGAADAATRAQRKALLAKSLQLDPKLAPGYLQLGIVYAEEKDLAQAIAAYRRAISIDPNLEQAHYRLAQAYRQTGETAKAREEVKLYAKIAQQNADENQRERGEVRQFIYQLPGQPSTPQ